MRRSFRSQLLALSFWLHRVDILDIHQPVTIRAAKAEHIPDMIRLARESSSAAHWSEQEYGRLFETPDSPSTRLALIAQRDVPAHLHDERSPLLGFLIAHHVGPEWELENVVVAPEARGRGIGARLMEELLIRAKQTNSEAVFLEVRESNQAARRLYQKLEFQETGRRKSYYTNPLEDAILYVRTLGARQISD